MRLLWWCVVRLQHKRRDLKWGRGRGRRWRLCCRRLWSGRSSRRGSRRRRSGCRAGWRRQQRRHKLAERRRRGCVLGQCVRRRANPHYSERQCDNATPQNPAAPGEQEQWTNQRVRSSRAAWWPATSAVAGHHADCYPLWWTPLCGFAASTASSSAMASIEASAADSVRRTCAHSATMSPAVS